MIIVGGSQPAQDEPGGVAFLERGGCEVDANIGEYWLVFALAGNGLGEGRRVVWPSHGAPD
eukprot:3024901-Pyramimonas_sp.AAC.1